MKIRVAYLILAIALSACVPAQRGMNYESGPLPVQNDSQSVRTESAGKESVFFAVQSSKLDPAEQKKLMALANVMRMNKTLRARFAGSTEHGTSNPSLALRRAIAVRNSLSQMGVPSSRLSVKDEIRSDTILSQQHPEKGDDASGRRVDIMIEAVTGQAI